MGSLSRRTRADQFSYVPAGTVLPFAGDTAPSGWAICNGDPVSRTDYPELFTAIGELWGVGDGSTTFNLPDMRGQFLRGLDTTEGVDPDFATRTLGSSQTDATNSSSLTYEDTYLQEIEPRYPRAGGQYLANFHPPRTGWSVIWQTGNGSGPALSSRLRNGQSTQSIGGGEVETRPKNCAVNYIIKL